MRLCEVAQPHPCNLLLCRETIWAHCEKLVQIISSGNEERFIQLDNIFGASASCRKNERVSHGTSVCVGNTQLTRQFVSFISDFNWCYVVCWIRLGPSPTWPHQSRMRDRERKKEKVRYLAGLNQAGYPMCAAGGPVPQLGEREKEFSLKTSPEIKSTPNPQCENTSWESTLCCLDVVSLSLPQGTSQKVSIHRSFPIQAAGWKTHFLQNVHYYC